MSGPSEKLEALVLRQVDYGESDRIVGMLTRSRGKLSAFAGGARKSIRRFGGSLDLFAWVEAEVSPPRSRASELWRLSSVDLRDPYFPLRRDVRRLAAASYMAECVWALAGEGDPQQRLFDWCRHALATLANSPDPDVCVPQLDLELLALCGFAPRWNACVECGRRAEGDPLFFSFDRGGVLCGRCRSSGDGRWLRAPLISAVAAGSEIPPEFRVSVRQVLEEYMAHTLGHEPRSRRFREEAFCGRS